jgi:hypothetical protein
MAAGEPRGAMTMRQLLAQMAWQYCRSAAWYVAAGQGEVASELLQRAVEVLTERELFQEVRDAG